MDLDFYNVDPDYIKYLFNYDNHVCLHKNGRPYLGIVFEFNNHDYFAPLTSDNLNNKKGKDSKEYLRKDAGYRRITVDIGKKDNQKIGFVRINNMIPVPKKCYKKMIINDIVDDRKYKILLLKQYRVFITPEFQQEVQIKTKRVYKISLNKNHHLNNKVCDFQLLEEKCDSWENK